MPATHDQMYSTEGGIRVPFVIRYPPKIAANKVVRSFATVMDIVPTFLELAGVTHPVPKGAKTANFRGHEVYPVRGHSWVPFFDSGAKGAEDMSAIYGGDEFMGWELFGRAALRKGKWKIVNMPIAAFGKGEWELFDIQKDPGETTDLAEKEPEKLKELLGCWEEYCRETGAVWGSPVQGELSWTPLPEDSAGGDPIAEMRSWMTIGEGEVSNSKPKHI